MKLYILVWGGSSRRSGRWGGHRVVPTKKRGAELMSAWKKYQRRRGFTQVMNLKDGSLLRDPATGEQLSVALRTYEIGKQVRRAA